MTRPPDRVWLCAIDVDHWSEVIEYVPRRHQPSPRIGEWARIAAVTSTALVSVAVHEMAASETSRGERALRGAVAGQDRARRPLESVQFSVSHSDQAIAVAAGFDPVGIDIESVEELGLRDARERARGRAARKAYGGAAIDDQEHFVLPEPGWCEVDDNRSWVCDVEWHPDFAIALAAAREEAPQVISTTASSIIQRWHEAVEGLEPPAARDLPGTHRTNLG